MLAQRPGMIGFVTQRQQPSVDLRVQRLDTPIHHLRKTGDLLDADDGHARLGQRLGSTAGTDDLDAVGDESLGEFDDAGLIGNTNQCTFDGDMRIGHPCPLNS